MSRSLYAFKDPSVCFGRVWARQLRAWGTFCLEKRLTLLIDVGNEKNEKMVQWCLSCFSFHDLDDAVCRHAEPPWRELLDWLRSPEYVHSL